MKKVDLGTWASVIDEDGNLWFSEFYFNGLFKLDIRTYEIDWIGKFDGVPVCSEGLHSCAYLYGDNIIFTPSWDTCIRIYNKKTRKFKSIKIPSNKIKGFYKSVQIEDSIFFISDDFRVWEYSLQNESIIENITLSNVCKEQLKDNKGVNMSIYSKGIVFWERGGKRGIRIDLTTQKVDILFAEIKGNLEKVFFDDEKYWFVQSDTLSVVCWDGKNSYDIYKAEIDDWVIDKKIIPYSEMYRTEKEVILTNYYGKFLMRINEEKKCVEKLFDYPADFKILNKAGYGATYTNLHVYNDTLLFVPQRANLLLYYNSKTANLFGIKLLIDKEKIGDWNEIIRGKWERSKILNEVEEIIDLSDLVSMTRLNIRNQNFKEGYKVGIDIFNFMNN